MSSLSDASSRVSSSVDRHVAELKTVQQELDSLRITFGASAESIIRQLEKEGTNAAALREAEQSHIREAAAQLRALRLTQVELETRSGHQDIERENLDRLAKQLAERRREWDDERPSIEAASLRERIAREIAVITAQVGRPTVGDVSGLVDESLRMITRECDDVKRDLAELGRANRVLLAGMHRLKGGPVASKRRINTRLLAEAQAMVDAIRSRRSATET
jgi:chromosome segregation ATPase